MHALTLLWRRLVVVERTRMKLHGHSSKSHLASNWASERKALTMSLSASNVSRRSGFLVPYFSICMANLYSSSDVIVSLAISYSRFKDKTWFTLAQHSQHRSHSFSGIFSSDPSTYVDRTLT